MWDSKLKSIQECLEIIGPGLDVGRLYLDRDYHFHVIRLLRLVRELVAETYEKGEEG